MKHPAYKLAAVILVLVAIGVFTYSQVKATDTSATSPGTLADDATVGTVAWSNPTNAASSNNVYARASIGTTIPKDIHIRIVKADGTIGTTNKADTATNWTTTDTVFPYGSSSDVWDETWTAEDINDADFGVVISAGAASTSHYLKATNFGFSIPTGATIDGIVVNIEKSRVGDGIDGYDVQVDHITITVSYTEGAVSNRQPTVQIQTRVSLPNGRMIIR